MSEVQVPVSRHGTRAVAIQPNPTNPDKSYTYMFTWGELRGFSLAFIDTTSMDG